ncbi:hypothetical protein BDV34DRAFT_179055 [Aspergillus parasiticus]|uniref:Secreted protein n=1 Tax=Aspergillus parasiticus TaxID=5067 RepID=A0A5N6DAM5_ASPPA|nr:hypothetical protein BDV34DRAFT_179055 [Aspergillus parasiticus]
MEPLIFFFFSFCFSFFFLFCSNHCLSLVCTVNPNRLGGWTSTFVGASVCDFSRAPHRKALISTMMWRKERNRMIFVSTVMQEGLFSYLISSCDSWAMLIVSRLL